MGAAEGHDRDLDEQVRRLLEADQAPDAVTLALRHLGPEVFGFIAGVLGKDADADEVFAVTSERLWRSLPTFQWRCPLRAWAYIIARHEIARFRSNERRHVGKRVPISQLEDVIAAITTQAHTHRSGVRHERLATFRDELPVDDRALLILRVDRQLSWDDIALAFVDEPASCGDDERKREAARLRKRFQLIKERLAKRARAEGLL